MEIGLEIYLDDGRRYLFNFFTENERREVLDKIKTNVPVLG